MVANCSMFTGFSKYAAHRRRLCAIAKAKRPSQRGAGEDAVVPARCVGSQRNRVTSVALVVNDAHGRVPGGRVPRRIATRDIDRVHAPGARIHAGGPPRAGRNQEEAAPQGARGGRVLSRPVVSRVRLVLAAVLLVAAAPAVASAQVFVASKPHPPFEIGPLFVRASVSPKLGPVDIDIFWSLAVPSNRSVAELEPDLWLVWPAALVPPAARRRDAGH